MDVKLIEDKHRCGCGKFYSLLDDQECPYCWNKYYVVSHGYMKPSMKAREWNNAGRL